jgi:N-methylhydantoinase B/oxoprolinase/acetone carboxylase alpha subunit
MLIENVERHIEILIKSKKLIGRIAIVITIKITKKINRIRSDFNGKKRRMRKNINTILPIATNV